MSRSHGHAKASGIRLIEAEQIAPKTPERAFSFDGNDLGYDTRRRLQRLGLELIVHDRIDFVSDALRGRQTGTRVLGYSG